MIRTLTAATLALAAIALPAAAQARGIERYPVPGTKPAPILQGVYVPAGSEMLYLSGQVASPIDPAKPMSPDLTMADYGDTKTQVVSCLGKIKAALEAHGFKMSDVIKLTVFAGGDPRLGGKLDFPGINAGYGQFFGTADNPEKVARSAIQVAGFAAPGLLVEIEATAAKAPGAK
jgi:2-iminobutanoate/2-iminopropanoate deaminase